MQIKDSKTNYGVVTFLFHWLMAFLIITLIGVGLYIAEVGFKDETAQLFALHKAFGIVILGLVVLRILWRFSNSTPELPNVLPAYQRLAAKAVHLLLYLMMILMPLSGWMMSSFSGYSVSFFGLFDMPVLTPVNRDLGKFFGEVHELSADFLIFLLVIHFSAALIHHFFYKDNVLKRMLLCRK